MDMTTLAVGAGAMLLSVGGSYMYTKVDIAVNTTNIQNITKQLDRIEKTVDEIAKNGNK
jgi:hypothetical protein